MAGPVPGPDRYEDWRHCITELCGRALTEGFVRARIAELSDPSDPATLHFVAQWGDEHRRRVLGWFARVERELGDG